MKRLHIVGCPRSGTTLLMEMASTCFQSSGYCAHEMSIFKEPDEPYELYFSKKPSDIKIIQPILEADPGLYVIYLVRDPRAVIASRHRSLPGKYFCNLRAWRECDQAAQAIGQHPRFLSLRYEDLVADADATQATIMQAFGFLEKRHAFSEYHLHSQASGKSKNAMHGLRPVSQDKVAAWREQLPRIKEQMQRHGGLQEALQRLGYEPNDSWQSELSDIVPEFTPSRYAESESGLRRLARRFRNWRKIRRKLRVVRERERAGRSTRA